MEKNIRLTAETVQKIKETVTERVTDLLKPEDIGELTDADIAECLKSIDISQILKTRLNNTDFNSIRK